MSKAESPNVQRLVDVLGSPKHAVYPEPAPMRKREWVLIALTLALATVYFDGSQNLPALAQKTPTPCERDRLNAERYAKVIAAVLNGRSIQVEGSTVASCRVKHLGVNS